jgi:hypothetical protein
MPMLPSMTTAVLTTALQRARVTWRGQLAVLAIGILLLGIVAGIGWQAPLLAGLVSMLLIGAATFAAGLEPAQLTRAGAREQVGRFGQRIPRLAAQVAAAYAPIVVLGFAAMQAASIHPLIGLVLLPFVFGVAVLTAPLGALAVGGAAAGDEAWLPLAGLRALRERPAAMLLATIVGGVLVALAALPVTLLGFVLTATLGPLGMLGMGIVGAGIAPLAGCWVYAFWRCSGAAVTVRARSASTPAEPSGALEAFASPWLDGPSWTVTLEPGTVWGTWVRLEAAAQVAIRVTWSGALAPQVAVGREDGSWMDPGQPVQNGQPLPVSLPAGNSYLQVGCREAAPQAVTMTMLVRAAAVAA